MSYQPENALIVQSDRTILLEVHAPTAAAARDAIAPFAELMMVCSCSPQQSTL